MKVIIISTETVKENLKQNKKLMLIIFLVCAILGVITGIISALTYNARSNIDTAQIESSLDLDLIEKDGSYYYIAFFKLKEKNDYINAYLQYLEQVDMGIESKNKLAALEEEWIEYQNEFDKAINFYENEAPVIYSEVDSSINFYEDKILELEEEQKEIEEEINKNNELGRGLKESDIEELTASIIKIEKNMEIFNNQISIIKNSSENEIIETTEKADSILANNIEYINAIIDSFNIMLSEIAKEESYEITYNRILLNDYSQEAGLANEWEKEDILRNTKGNAIIYAKSIEGLDIRSERFFAIITFFFLMGVVISLIVGAIYKRKHIC